MAYNFSANQFERAFKPKSLSNWEVAKWFPDRPRTLKAPTRIIVNDQGHLLPGVQRPTTSPWGTYKGTWQLPNKITREIASEITAPQVRARRSWEKRSLHVPILSQEKGETEQEPISDTEIQQKSLEKEARKRCSPSHYDAVSQPYDHHANDDYSRPTGQEHSPDVINTTSPVLNAVDEYKRHCVPVESIEERNEQYKKQARNEDLIENHDKPECHAEGVTDNMSNKGTNTSDGLRNMPPLATAYCNPQIARNLAVENLRHHPLPDTVENALYRSLQMKKDKNPGRNLNVEPRAAAVGCKGYGVPGPTQCSKLKVYRPKTAGIIPNNKEHKLKEMNRPKTSNSNYRNKHLSQMQLALCWDLKPPHPGDEPKRTHHIDGSNGSAAPAVFALVQPPDENTVESPAAHLSPSTKALEQCQKHPRGSANGGQGSRPASTKSASSGGRNGSANRLMKRQPRSAWEIGEQKRVVNPSAVMDIINSGDVQQAPLLRPQPFQKLKEDVQPQAERNSRGNSADSKDSKLSKSKQHCHSTPNLTTSGIGEELQTNGKPNNINGNNTKNKLLNNRPCMACEMKVNTSPTINNNGSLNGRLSNKQLSNDNNNNINYSNDSTISTIKSQKTNGSNNNVQVPKPRTPYAKRSYSIGTLAPPFSLWPGTTGHAYPEHWRLASVYQHSYKPIQSRRKTFLQSVYQ